MSFLDQLNLRPQEKRILAGVLVVVTVLVSVFFVWPKLGDWERAQNALKEARKKLANYQAEINRTPDYEARLRELEGQGSAVLPEEQALQLMRTIQTQANQHGVLPTSTRGGTPGTATSTSTNSFFDEQVVNIGVSTDEEPLVNFLHSLGTGNSMIRVRDMDLRPDPPRYKLNGSITLVASYQKKPKASRPAPASAPAPAPASVSTNLAPSPKP